ncbi:ABC transporter substrate-binding protein [Amycolatopsis suaedae]|uniref:ABC transporter substrate-binding protein n=1 Tax=Amycolatopsis suaedae TaxID=2510978 RepID=A0A4Q7J666_9PSEU|nr:ABC transporter substrate-binding protein [Amycolatopsis suaedae]RZQ61793.1 ABC transporter substrate-binding protein [Amycolatopsis suaedae]
MSSRRWRTVTMQVIVLFAISACSLWSGEQARQAPALERNTLRVVVGNPIESAPLRMATADGLFERAGLRIELIEQAAPDDGLTKLTSGEADVAFASDFALFRAATQGLPLQLQGEAYTAGANSMALMILPDSSYDKPAAKRSPRIAVDTLDGLGTLTSRSALATAGVAPEKIKFVQRDPGEMMRALQKGEADAAWMVEPHITTAEEKLGARVLTDTARGATTEFPMSAYAATEAFAKQNPNLLAEFRRLLGLAQQRADDPAAVRKALPSFAGIDGNTASLVALGTYPTSLSGVRLQRVADLMHGSGALSTRLDVQSLLPGH